MGRRITCTWQTGEPAIIAAKAGVPVVSDFRPADMAVGGKGAPLVPFLDYVLYRHRRYGRIVQNLGGIGNLTAIPPRAQPDELVAFDTGPGNMVIDAVTEHLFDKPFDRNGRLAARGEPIERVLRELLRHPFFRQKPPKTAGREQFGREFVRELLRLCRRADQNDIVATATALTARSIGIAVRRFVLPLLESETARFREFVVSGGGTKNPTLMRMIREELAPLKMRVRRLMILASPPKRKRRPHSRCWPIRRGDACRRTCLPPPAPSGRRSWARSAMRRPLFTTENTERTEKTRNQFTTEARRHREEGKERKNKKEENNGLHGFAGQWQSYYQRDLRSKFSLRLHVSAVDTFGVFSVRSVFSVVTLFLALLLTACSQQA